MFIVKFYLCFGKFSYINLSKIVEYNEYGYNEF